MTRSRNGNAHLVTIWQRSGQMFSALSAQREKGDCSYYWAILQGLNADWVRASICYHQGIQRQNGLGWRSTVSTLPRDVGVERVHFVGWMRRSTSRLT